MTYKDLQQRTGLSLATISKYFNGRPLREPNRIAIETAAAELGYRINTLAQNMRTQRSRTVGVLLPALNNNFHLSVIAGVEHSLWKAGIGVVVSTSRGESGRPGEAVDFLSGRMVDGIIAVPTHHDAPALIDASVRGLPVVLVDRVVDGLVSDAVVLDNHGAARLSVQHLLDHGHREISAIGGPAEVGSLVDRTAGVLDTLERAGLVAGPGTVRTAPLTVEAGRDAMWSLLAQPDRPTGVVCLNYELTVGALIALNESGLRIPEDLSLVGFDSLELAQVTKPRLSMVTQPTHEIAVRAAALMADRLAGGTEARPARRVVLPAELVPGGSVTRPRSRHMPD